MTRQTTLFGRISTSIHSKLLLAAVALQAPLAHAALTKTDLTQDASGGKTLVNVAENTNASLESFISLMLAISAFIGLIITMMSAYQIWKAGKDEREKPVSAMIGLGVGGLMLAIPTIMWLVRNTFLGTS